MTDNEFSEETRPATVDEFVKLLADVQENLDSVPRLRAIVRLIQRGFGQHTKDLPDPSEVERIECVLRNICDPVDVALKLSGNTTRKRGSLPHELRKRVAERLRDEFGFQTVRTDEEADRASLLIYQLVASAQNLEELTLTMRRILVGLMAGQRAEMRTRLIQTLFEHATDHHARKYDSNATLPEGGTHQEHLLTAIRLVAGKTVNLQAIKTSGILGLPTRLCMEECRQSTSYALAGKSAAEVTLKQTLTEYETLQQRYNVLSRKLDDTRLEVAALKDELAREKRRTIETRDTLTTKHTNQMGGRANRLAKTLNLELEEARICLDRDEPNVEMALNRLKDIHNTLKTFAENQS